MRAQGNTTVWGSHIGVGSAQGARSWYQQLRDWWATHKEARREAQLASLDHCWDGKREVFTPLGAEAAPEMAIARGALSMAMKPYSLIQ